MSARENARKTGKCQENQRGEVSRCSCVEKDTYSSESKAHMRLGRVRKCDLGGTGCVTSSRTGRSE